MSDNEKLIEEDRREATLDSERLRQLAEWLAMEIGHEETAKRVNSIADRLDRLAAGFSRSDDGPMARMRGALGEGQMIEVPEPSAEDRPYVASNGNRFTADQARLITEPLRYEPQGEPSDERVNAALNAHRLSDLLNSGYGPERFHKAPDLSYWHPDHVSNMRAALRAAGVVGQEGESRG